MSAGPRIPLRLAQTICEHLRTGLFGKGSSAVWWTQLHEVGSVRRQRPDVGDVEMIAPLPPARLGVGGESPLTQVTDRGIKPLEDPLFLALNRAVENPAKVDVDLFSADPLDELVHWDEGHLRRHGISIRAIEGFSPGFRAVKLAVSWRDMPAMPAALPVQIYRYTPNNYGWIRLMRTGPADFGEHFLREWKRAQRIPRDRQGSIQGHLVDTMGRVVSVVDEEAAFRRCGMPFIAPEGRGPFMERIRLSREHLES